MLGVASLVKVQAARMSNCRVLGVEILLVALCCVMSVGFVVT